MDQNRGTGMDPMLLLKHFLLLLPLLFTEGVTSVNLTSTYSLHEPHFAASALLSGAFSVLLAASTVLVAKPRLPSSIRVLLMCGISVLFCIQAVSNISGAWLTATAHETTFDTLTRLWGPSWMAVSSATFGGGINIVAMCYWCTLAFSLRQDLIEQQKAREERREWEELQRLALAELKRQQEQTQADEPSVIPATPIHNGRGPGRPRKEPPTAA